jgi:hypothetical protein
MAAQPMAAVVVEQLLELLELQTQAAVVAVVLLLLALNIKAQQAVLGLLSSNIRTAKL